MSQQDSPQPTGAQSNEPQPHEAQRLEAWAAVHRPDTSSDALARIAEAHPEFAAAIAEHPNAPAVKPVEPLEPVEPVDLAAQSQPGHIAHYDQPQFAQPEHEQHQPQHTPPQYAQPAHPQHWSNHGQMASASENSKKPNIPGVIALSLLVLTTVLGFFWPYVMRQAMIGFDMGLLVGFPLLRLLLTIAAIVLGVIGLKMRSHDRFRWMAVGSVVAGALLIIPLFLTTLTYASPRLFGPYYF